MSHNTEKSATDYSNVRVTELKVNGARRMALLREVMDSENIIADTVNKQYGRDASKGMYSIEHISLSGNSVSSISLDINEFRA